jgi:hypothetical protein
VAAGFWVLEGIPVVVAGGATLPRMWKIFGEQVE